MAAIILAFHLAGSGVIEQPAAEGGNGVELRLRSFPGDAQLLLHGDYLPPLRTEEDGWRVYRLSDTGQIPVLVADGYRPRPLHLLAAHGTIAVEERLLPLEGPLQPVGEFPTGAAPKSVTFLPDDRLVVPLIRDNGIDLFRMIRDRNNAELDHLGTFGPAGQELRAYVEPLVLRRRGEIWVSRMDPDEVHRFELAGGRWLGSVETGGRWPKVLVADNREERVYVANWLSETVTVLDGGDGSLLATIPVGGQPRGMWLSPDDSLLWVCIFSTGDIEVIDTDTSEVVHRMGLPPGAARHIVGNRAGTTFYYSDMYHGTVSMIDPRGRVVTGSRRVGPNVNTIVLDPREEFLFVSVRGRNNRENYLLPGPEHGRIVVLDARTLEQVQEIWARRQPTGLAVSPDGGYLVATDFLDDNLAVYRIDR